jgi:hypothetical protein
MKLTRTHHLLAASLATAISHVVSAEIILNVYNGPNNFAYAVFDMPDFDQRRLNVLPGNGGCHCVPTSGSDLLAYAATHGFDSIAPGIPNFDGWESNTNYNAATNIINALGIETNVAPGGAAGCGTNFGQLTNSLTARAGLFFTVTLDSTATLEEIAQRGANSAAISTIAYGRHNGAFNAAGNFVRAGRSGGHAEVANFAIAGPGLRTLGVRNPAGSDSPTDLVQSTFKTEWFNVTNQPIQWSNGSVSTRQQLGPALLNNARLLLLESSVSISPKAAFAWDEFTESTYGKWFPQMFLWAEHFTLPELSRLPYKITKLQPFPGSDDLAAIIEQSFYLLDPETGEPRPLPPLPPDPITDLDVDRFGQIHLAADNSVISINPEPKIHTVIPMPGEVAAVAAASAFQESRFEMQVPVAYALIVEPAMIVAIYQNRDGYATEAYTLDATSVINPDSMLVAMPAHVCVLTNGRLETFKMDLGDEGFVPTNVDQPLSGIRDVVADDNNVLLLASGTDTTYTAWEFAGNRFDSADWHPLHRVETPGRLAVRRSNNDVKPWDNVDRSITEYDERDQNAVAAITHDCRSDLNFDGKVDGADMGILLAEWGTSRSIADISRDGTVDGADLGLMLGAFGDCP